MSDETEKPVEIPFRVQQVESEGRRFAEKYLFPQMQQAYDDGMIAGTVHPVYRFDHGVLGDDDVSLNAHEIEVGGRKVSLDLASPFSDMLD